MRPSWHPSTPSWVQVRETRAPRSERAPDWCPYLLEEQSRQAQPRDTHALRQALSRVRPASVAALICLHTPACNSVRAKQLKRGRVRTQTQAGLASQLLFLFFCMERRHLTLARGMVRSCIHSSVPSVPSISPPLPPSQALGDSGARSQEDPSHSTDITQPHRVISLCPGVREPFTGAPSQSWVVR